MKGTQYTSDIVCPHCGYEDLDSWEYDRDDDTIHCDSCSKLFYYMRYVTTEYCTRKSEK